MKITRSFSKKIQLRQFEPIEVFCAAEDEGNEKSKKRLEEISKELDEFCRNEVEKTLNLFRTVDTKKSQDVGLDDFENDLHIEI